jgi:hypothetical protein
VAADGEAGVIYTVASPSDLLWPQQAMFASRWRSDASLVDVDRINLQQQASDLAVGGGLSYTADDSGRISARVFDSRTGQIHLLARTRAFQRGPARLALGRPTLPRLSDAAGPPATMLAVSSGAGLRLLEIGDAGRLTPRGSFDLPPLEPVRRLAFHPSGRYLYTSGEGEGVRVFRVGEDGSLRETAQDTRGGGEIVVTAPPS